MGRKSPRNDLLKKCLVMGIVYTSGDSSMVSMVGIGVTIPNFTASPQLRIVNWPEPSNARNNLGGSVAMGVPLHCWMVFMENPI